MGTLNCNGGRCQQTGVQQLCLLGFGHLGDQHIGQLYQQSVQGHQHSRCNQVETSVDHGDVPCLYRIMQERPLHKHANAVENHSKHDCADHVKQQVHHSRSARIAVCTNGTHNGSNTSADVLTQNDGDCCTVSNGAGCAKTLQNTNRGGRGLNNCSQNSTKENADNRIGEGDHQVSKPCFCLQESHGTAH